MSLSSQCSYVLQDAQFKCEQNVTQCLNEKLLAPAEFEFETKKFNSVSTFY